MQLVTFKSKSIIESNHTIRRKLKIYKKNNTRTPFTSQVEALASPPTENINNIKEEPDSKIKPKNVTFQLSPQHIERDSTKWQATPHHKKVQKTRLKVENARLHKARQKKPLMQDNIRTMILNGTIPSAFSDTGDTSTEGKGGHPFRLSNHPLDKVSIYQQEAQPELA